MSATTYNFFEAKDPAHSLPDFLFLDTSFLVNSFVPVPEATSDLEGDSRYKQCAEFLSFLQTKAQNEQVNLFISDSVFVEAWVFILWNLIKKKELESASFQAHDTYYRENPKGSKDHVKRLLKDHPEVIDKHFAILKDFYEKITNVPIAILTPDILLDRQGKTQISDRISYLVSTYKILPADAQHISTGLAAGIEAFVSVDYDFQRVGEITVYASSVKRPPSCKFCNRGAGR